jgi:hypothetical protein
LAIAGHGDLTAFFCHFLLIFPFSPADTSVVINCCILRLQLEERVAIVLII